MRLQAKFALYNILTKIAIILSVYILFELTVERVAYNHLDARILQKKELIMSKISSKTISEYISEQDTDFASYNILKEEYILLKVIPPVKEETTVGNFSDEPRIIENQTSNYRILTYDFDFQGQQYQLEIGESLASIQQFQTSLRTYTIIVLCVSVLLSLLSDFLFTGFLLRPLASIINKRLENVNDPSHFNYEVIQTSTTDFQHLDNQLKDMLKRIEHSFFTQKEFIANVSHELLTPISILKTRFENLLNEAGTNEEVQNQIYSSLNTLHWLKNIVNSLLLISKIENEQFEQNEEIELEQLLEKITEDVEHRLEEKSVKINLNLQQHHHFYGNTSLIRTMLFNVITNAIKYNKYDGEINITDGFDNGHYQLTIRDTGVGIEPQKLRIIFNRFEKLDSTSENSHGLGLSIVQSVAHFHKIKINVTSALHNGTAFIFTFPA